MNKLESFGYMPAGDTYYKYFNTSAGRFCLHITPNDKFKVRFIVRGNMWHGIKKMSLKECFHDLLATNFDLEYIGTVEGQEVINILNEEYKNLFGNIFKETEA